MEYPRIKNILFSVIICFSLAAAIYFAVTWISSAASSANKSAGDAETLPILTDATEATVAETTFPTIPPMTEEFVPETTETVPQTEPENTTVDIVPTYYQTDYADVHYGTSTIEKSGSNMTALAMVASYMTDHIYYPDEIADYCADYIGNHINRLDYASDMLQLSWRRATNFHDALKALKEGSVVIAAMDESSLFSNGLHFIVWTGMTDDGLIQVNDPNDRNHTAWNLKDGFENGFREGILVCGYTGGWIYDKSSMPEEPFIYEPVPYAEECRYPDITLTDADKKMMAKIICAEAASEPFEGQQAIAEVILNRLASDRFPNTVRGIIYAHDQFAGAENMDATTPTYSQYKAIERAMYGPYILPDNAVYFAKFAVNKNVWGTIGSHIFCIDIYQKD